MRMLTIFSFVGAILCICATVFTSKQYIALSQDIVVIEALAPGDDVMLSKLSAMLEGYQNSEFILVELKARWARNTLLHETMTRMITTSKQFAFYQMLLWLISSAIFIALLIWLALFRRNKIREN